MANDTYSNEIYSQVGKKHMTHLVKNDQWNFNQVGHLIKMANFITTYLPTHLPMYFIIL